MQPPALYRLFGDKDGLLEAVAEHGYSTVVAAKLTGAHHDDPIEDLRAGWDLAVEFGLTHPALYTLVYAEPRVATTSPASRAGLDVLAGRIQRLARRRLAPGRRAPGRRPDPRHGARRRPDLALAPRTPSSTGPLLTAMRESMVVAVTTEQPAVQVAGPSGAARALRAALPDQTSLINGEQQLLGEWLDRLAADAPAEPD